MKDIHVSVHMSAYNQQEYIAEAIEHVLRQKTAFPIELIIGEDCSTDGTREIIFSYQKKHPDVIRVITSDSNVGPAENKNRILGACRGKYVAFCDGDDYWQDPDKLQRQADFLDTHSDYGLVHTDFDRLNDPEGRRIPCWQQSNGPMLPQGRVYEELLLGTFISTSTVFARRELVARWLEDAALSDKNFIQRDYATWLFIAWHSKICYLPLSTTTKRHLRESMSRSRDQRKKHKYYLSLYAIQKTFMERFPCSERTKKRIMLDFHIKNLRFSCGASDFQSAKESYLYLRRQNSLSFRHHYYFAASFIKSIIRL